MKYVSENHSKLFIMCHLIFVCKYRKKLLSKVGHEIKGEIECISNHYGWEIIEQEVDQDHIHVFIRYSPKWSILEIVNNFLIFRNTFLPIRLSHIFHKFEELAISV